MICLRAGGNRSRRDHPARPRSLEAVLANRDEKAAGVDLETDPLAEDNTTTVRWTVDILAVGGPDSR